MRKLGLSRINRVIESLEKRSPFFWIIMGIILVGLLGIIDYLTGNEITFSLFYLAPIVLVTWSTNQNLGLIVSFLSALTLLAAEVVSGQSYSNPIIYLWNILLRFGFYVIVTYLVSELRKSQEAQQALIRTDYVSGAVSARYFYELLEMEMGRSRRYSDPYTVVYMDMDNFKKINDTFGHAKGDEVLRFIASELKQRLRSTDVIARLGGDEFALLLPVTGQTTAEIVISKIHASLADEMQQKNWPVSFSMGAVTCVAASISAEDLIKMADELMYMVKNSTKDGIRFVTYRSKQSIESG